jgi:hypothetical protein
VSHHSIGNRILKYQGNTFKKECDVTTLLLPGPKSWS